jgi:signal transduction histidine kinase
MCLARLPHVEAGKVLLAGCGQGDRPPHRISLVSRNPYILHPSCAPSVILLSRLRKENLLAERTLAVYTLTRTSLNAYTFHAPSIFLPTGHAAPLNSLFVMTSHPPNTDIAPSSSSELLNVVTQFSAELGTMTDLTAIGNRIIQELCRAVAATRGALFLLDREHECYRQVGTIGPVTPTLIPLTLSTNHSLPRHLLTTNKIITRDDTSIDPQESVSGTDVRAAMETMQATLIVPHLIKGRLIAFSLLDASIPIAGENVLTRSILAALAQTATNALDTIVLYDDLHRSHMLMKRTDRLKSLETIAGGFAHEIRNPLTSIKTFIQLAPQRKDDPQFIHEFSKMVLDDVYRIERLIQEILDYARYMEPKLTDEDFNDIVASCLYFIDVKADRQGIKIEKELAPDLPRVMLDRQQIKQVLLNLLLNAMDSMIKSGERLRVQTRKLVKPGGHVWVHIEIEDTGEGILETNLDHIFDPFFTTKHASGEHEGTGLGLTIVHQIIQEHHGEIRVKSSIGVGTTFFVSLPALSA